MTKCVHKKHLWLVTYKIYFEISYDKKSNVSSHTKYILTELDSIENVVKNLKAALDCQYWLTHDSIVKAEYLGEIYNTHLTEQEEYDP